MKVHMRLFSIFLCFSFFMATTGFNVYEHYCNGQLLDTSVYQAGNHCSEDHSEDSCSMNAMDCCQDQMEFHKLDVDLKHSEWLKIVFPYLPVVLDISNWDEEIFYHIDEDRLFANVIPLVPLYIFYQQLTYYH